MISPTSDMHLDEQNTGSARKTPRTPLELGRLVRDERKAQSLTLQALYESSGLTTRFLSEFERGKPNVSLARVMETLEALGLRMVVLPRGEADTLLARYQRLIIEENKDD